MVKRKLTLEQVKTYLLKVLARTGTGGNVGDQEAEEVESGAGSLHKAARVVYPIGMVRVWKGKKFRKVGPNKWMPVFEGQGKERNVAAGWIVNLIKKAPDMKQLMVYVKENKDRFRTEGGKIDPFVGQMLKVAKERREQIAPKPKLVAKVKEPTPAPEPPKPVEDNWAGLPYAARIAKDRDRFVKEVVKARMAKIGGNDRGQLDRYRLMNDAQLARKGGEYMGPEPKGAVKPQEEGPQVKLVVKVPGVKAGPKGKGPDLGAKVHLDKWMKADPVAFMQEFADKYVAAHPGQGLTPDEVKRRWRRANNADLVDAAKKLGMKAKPAPEKPKDWDQLDFAAKANANPVALAQDIVAGQVKKGRRRYRFQDRAANIAYYAAMPPDQLADKARQYLGEDVPERAARLAREAIEAKARIESAAKAEEEPVPAGWSKLDYAGKVNKNKKAFAEEILRKRFKDWEGVNFNPKDPLHREKFKNLLAFDDDRLVRKAEDVMGKDPVKHAAALAAQKAREQLLLDMIKSDLLDSPEEKHLATGGIVSKKNIGGGINTTAKIVYKMPDGTERNAIFKSQAGEYDGDVRAGNIPIGEQWKRERLGYLVNAAIGLDIVPPVVIREVEGNVGAAMDFVDGEEWANAPSSSRQKVPDDQWQKLALQDWITGNTDRHGKNWMVTSEGKLWGIDNGLAFPEKATFHGGGGYRSKPHRILMDLAIAAEPRGGQYVKNVPLPTALIEKMTPEAKKKCVDAMILYQIGGKGIDLFKKRWDHVVQNKALPAYRGYDFMEATTGIKGEIDK